MFQLHTSYQRTELLYDVEIGITLEVASSNEVNDVPQASFAASIVEYLFSAYSVKSANESVPSPCEPSNFLAVAQ